MKKSLALLLCLMLAVSMLAGCGSSSAGQDANQGQAQQGGDNQGDAASGEKVVKIGIFEPASGDNGAGGKQETLGIEYAKDVTPTVEIGGETYTVELVPVDNESSTDKAPSAASNLVSAGVSVVLGSYGSGVSIAASDVFANAGIPAIGVTCTNPQVTEGNTHYFRICFLDPFQGTVLGDDYSVGLCHYFKEAFTALGGEVIEETFPDGNSDFTSYLTNAANAGADVFFAPVSTEAAALIIDQAASQGSKMPIMAGDTWDSNVITAAAKGKDVQIYVTTFYQEGGNEEFDKNFKEWLNADSTRLANNNGNDMISAVSAMGYDAYYTALEALKAAGSTDPKAVNEALWNVTYTGVSGDIAFDQENGDAIRDVAYVKKANTETGVWDFVAVQGVK